MPGRVHHCAATHNCTGSVISGQNCPKCKNYRPCSQRCGNFVLYEGAACPSCIFQYNRSHNTGNSRLLQSFSEPLTLHLWITEGNEKSKKKTKWEGGGGGALLSKVSGTSDGASWLVHSWLVLLWLVSFGLVLSGLVFPWLVSSGPVLPCLCSGVTLTGN